MELLYYALIGAGLFIVLALLFRHTITALFYDYVIDFGLSTADNFLAGAGLIGLDVGDWLAAIIIFVHERKVSGGFVAFIAAWEAANFLPLSFIPVFGEGLEIVLNLTPSVFISRLFFNKFSKAEQGEKHLERNYELAKKLGLKVSGLEEIQEKVEKNPVRALVLEHRLRSKLKARLEPKVQEIINRNRNQKEQLAQFIGVPQDVDILFEEVDELVKNEYYAKALHKNNEIQARLLELTTQLTQNDDEYGSFAKVA